MFQATHRVNGGILWANTHLLFWLSLVPFSTAWLSETHFAGAPAALYGLTLLAPAIAYFILSRALIRSGALDQCRGRHRRGHERQNLARVLLLRRALAFAYPYASMGLYAVVAMIWLVPDRRIEGRLEAEGEAE